MFRFRCPCSAQHQLCSDLACRKGLKRKGVWRWLRVFASKDWQQQDNLDFKLQFATKKSVTGAVAALEDAPWLELLVSLLALTVLDGELRAAAGPTESDLQLIEALQI